MIYLEYGGYFESTTKLYSLPEGHILYQHNPYGKMNYGEEKIRIARPTLDQWVNFKKKMKDFPDWNQYFYTHICDGLEWEFFYEDKDHKIRCKGHMAWPPEFYKLLANLKELCGFKRWHFYADEEEEESEEGIITTFTSGLDNFQTDK